jgi:hypothetical protein
MSMTRWLPACALFTLAGCGVGITPGGASLSGSFNAPMNVQRAYQGAYDQARLCLLGTGGYKIEGGLDAARRGGVVRVAPALFGGGDVASVEVAAVSDAQTRVTVSMWGKSLWDASAMHAMHDAVIFGAPSCASFMPAGKGPAGLGQDTWFTHKK